MITSEMYAWSLVLVLAVGFVAALYVLWNHKCE
jgi:hypothetical protein